MPGIYITSENLLVGEAENIARRLRELEVVLATCSAVEMDRAVAVETKRQMVAGGADPAGDLFSACHLLEESRKQRRDVVDAIAHAKTRLSSVETELRLLRNKEPDQGKETP